MDLSLGYRTPAQVFHGDQTVREESRKRADVQTDRCWDHMQESQNPDLTLP